MLPCLRRLRLKMPARRHVTRARFPARRRCLFADAWLSTPREAFAACDCVYRDARRGGGGGGGKTARNQAEEPRDLNTAHCSSLPCAAAPRHATLVLSFGVRGVLRHKGGRAVITI